MSKKVPNIRINKKNEFAAFIRNLKTGSVCHWLNMAEALGVDKDTVQVWKELPEAQKAIQDGIDYAMEQMERSGKSDWRMWKDKLAMLKVVATERIEHSGEINTKEELIIRDGQYEPSTDTTEGQSGE